MCNAHAQQTMRLQEVIGRQIGRHRVVEKPLHLKAAHNYTPDSRAAQKKRTTAGSVVR